jgi:hypothetical protein
VRPFALLLAPLCALVLGACGDTLQTRPIAAGALESLVVSPTPAYWVGSSFRGLGITEATHDPSGALSVQYGDCLQGGQGICNPPLRIVTSPDNSFLPGGAAPSTLASIRGVPALLARAGRTIVMQTGGVVLDIYGSTAQLARAAAQTAVPIDEVGVPGGQLPAPLPNTGFGDAPLPSQMPSPLRALARGSRTHS